MEKVSNLKVEVTEMLKKVYNFNIEQPFTFFKAGQFMTPANWKHKTIINDGDFEIMLVISGSIFLDIGGEQFQVNDHECIIVPPYTKHFGYKGATPNSTHYWLHFFPHNQVTELTHNQLVATEVDDLNKGDNILVPQHFRVRNFTRLVVPIRQLLDGVQDKDSLPQTTNYLVTSVVIELANQYRTILKEQQRTKGNMRFEEIKSWIRLNSHEPITAHDVALKFDYSLTYLNELFQKYNNKTTTQYLQTEKIEQAQYLLLSTDKSIKEIAFELNYATDKYFMRIFKQVTKTTPTKFRNAYSKIYRNNLKVDPPIPRPN